MAVALVVARRRVTAAVLDVRADMVIVVIVEMVFWTFFLNDGVYFGWTVLPVADRNELKRK